MADLPTNLKDDILDSSVNTRRKYRMIENEDGTYSFEDATEYSQVGDEYGAGLINETNKQVNAKVEKTVVVRDLETIGAITEEGFIPDALALKDVNDSLGGLSFGIDGDGNYGYYGADGSLIPFKSGKVLLTTFSASSSTKTVDCTSIPNWQNKTVDNFVAVVTSVSSSGSGGADSAGTASTSISLKLTYDATTGKLTIPQTSKSASINSGGKDVTPAKTTLKISGKIYYY